MWDHQKSVVDEIYQLYCHVASRPDDPRSRLSAVELDLTEYVQCTSPSETSSFSRFCFERTERYVGQCLAGRCAGKDGQSDSRHHLQYYQPPALSICTLLGRLYSGSSGAGDGSVEQGVCILSGLSAASHYVPGVQYSPRPLIQPVPVRGR